MNLYFRLLGLLFRALLTRTFADPLGKTCLTFRAWPWDIDINMHVTNARYQSFMDLGRTWHLLTTGLWRPVWKNKWLPVLHASHITYLRPIEPLQKFELHSMLEGWDEKYFYMRQEFRHGDHLLAIGLVRGLFVQGRQPIPTQKLLATLDKDVPAVNKNALLKEWETFLTAQRKNANQTER